jgi:urease gamma subunit
VARVVVEDLGLAGVFLFLEVFEEGDRIVRLSPSEQEKLLLSVAGMIATSRRARGVKLNAPEATALLSCWVLEAARDGDRTVEQLMQDGREVLGRSDVMEGVPELVDEVQIEATFPDGRKLVTLHQPIQ